MRELFIGAEVFEAPQSRILDFRFEDKRGWFGQSHAVCVIVTAAGEFSGQGRSSEDAEEMALEAWEAHFLAQNNDEAAATEPVDESGYMSSQMFSDRKGKVA